MAARGDQFQRRIYGIAPGSNQPMLDMGASGMFGLKGWEVIESSEQGMLAQVKRAMQRHEWIVLSSWQPHPMNMKMQLEYLADDDAIYGPRFCRQSW